MVQEAGGWGREKEGKRVVVVKGGGQVDNLLKILVGSALVSLSVICHQNYYLVVVRYIWCFVPFLSPAAYFPLSSLCLPSFISSFSSPEQHLPVVLFIMLYKVVLPSESVNEILKLDQSNESY